MCSPRLQNLQPLKPSMPALKGHCPRGLPRKMVQRSVPEHKKQEKVLLHDIEVELRVEPRRGSRPA
eukprot:8400447-Karenia_brevis.AAC.1